MKKYIAPIAMFIIFETVAVTLWLTMDNLFYLLNFSYIGMSIALGIFLFIRKERIREQQHETQTHWDWTADSSVLCLRQTSSAALPDADTWPVFPVHI